jgi:cysteine desulfurase
MSVREGSALEAVLVGGGQERERRSGTHNVPGIVALGEALARTDAERTEENVRIGALRDRLVDGLTGNLPGVRETVPRTAKVAGSAHVMFEGVEGEALLFLLDRAGVCASAASSCASGAMDPSHVLAAMGVDPTWAGGAVRMSLGRTTTDADVERALDVFTDVVPTLRSRMRAAVPQ